ncbi:GNAT family N-acetyltransferase [Cupriavidus basilensis]|uniref:GNAT family N-acetyltransferase n=1 Tax=Cupriavidus basilensis TaxID=68895 RepID=UPI00157A499E|nr:GNAT family N-acetyltransferase [Cupriavidus basilensis]
MNTYDAAYARLSPGTVLIDACVNWAFDNHLDFDFGAGGQSYKQFWSKGVAYATESLHLAHTQWGLAGYRLSQGALWARERVAWLRERAGDTGAGKPAESSTAG